MPMKMEKENLELMAEELSSMSLDDLDFLQKLVDERLNEKKRQIDLHNLTADLENVIFKICELMKKDEELIFITRIPGQSGVSAIPFNLVELNNLSVTMRLE